MKITLLLPVFKKLYILLSKKHKAYLAVLIFFTIGLSLIETIGISAIMPFISAASNPGLLDSGWYKIAYDFFGFTKAFDFILVLGIAIIIYYLFRAVYNAVHIYLINRFSQAIYKFFSKNLFNSFLMVQYKVFVQRNSGELMNIVTNISRDTGNLTLNVLQLGSELFTILLVYALMILVNWKMTLVLTAVLSLIVLCFLFILVTKSKSHGIKQTYAGMNLSRTLRETFGNFKFIKLKGTEKTALNNFCISLDTYSRAQIVSNTLGNIPKTILESIGFSLLIAAVIAILIVFKDASMVIPVISMYALALYRMLPSIHRMLNNINNIAYYQKSLDVLDSNINQPIENEGSAPVEFNKNIRLENVSFSYNDGITIFDSVSLEIEKGEKLAITGESGCGKSTLVDIIIGIHKPVSGSLFIDDKLVDNESIRDWRSKIGYIPQAIYLFDGSVAENICLGSKYDEEKIKQVLQMANIWDFLETKEGLHTKVGEGGIQLSGGQQQRIGIARALYDDPDVLVLDEATSALDMETEKKIMEEIYTVTKTKTLIVIAHRLSTVEHCDRKISIENGKITGIKKID
jgi:ATP-binding cassette subfamily B protein/ATP-binding cassette subfamily C protein